MVKMKLNTIDQPHDSIVDSVRESEKLSEAGVIIQFNSSIAPIDSTMRVTNTNFKKVEAKDLFPQLH